MLDHAYYLQYKNVKADFVFFFFHAEDGIRDGHVTGVQTCALPIWAPSPTIAAAIASSVFSSFRRPTKRSIEPARKGGFVAIRSNASDTSHMPPIASKPTSTPTTTTGESFRPWCVSGDVWLPSPEVPISFGMPIWWPRLEAKMAARAKSTTAAVTICAARRAERAPAAFSARTRPRTIAPATKKPSTQTTACAQRSRSQRRNCGVEMNALLPAVSAASQRIHAAMTTIAAAEV